MANANILNQFENKPFATLGELMDTKRARETDQLRNDVARQSLQIQQQKLQKEQAEEQKAQQRQALAQEAFTKFSRPDGTVDQKAVVAYLQPKDYEAAQAVSKFFNDQQELEMKVQTAKLTQQEKQWSLVGQALQGATPETYQGVLARVKAIDPEMGDFLGPQYDPNKLQTALAMGTSRSDWNKNTIDTLTSNDKKVDKALRLLSNAQDEQHGAEALAFAKSMGVDDDLASMGFGQWTPDAPQRAANFLMGPDKVATLAEQKADNERQAAQFAQTNAIARGQLAVAQGNLAQRKAEAASGGGSGAGGAKLSATAIEKVAGADQALGMIEDIERILPKMSGSIGPIDQWITAGKLATGKGVTKDLADFDTQLTALKNAVVKATTGAAMSEPEAKRILGQVPALGNPERVFKSRLEMTKRNLELLKKRTIELSGGVAPEMPAQTGTKTKVGRFEVEVEP